MDSWGVPSLHLRCVIPNLALFGFWRFKLMSRHLHGKHCNPWTISQAFHFVIFLCQSQARGWGAIQLYHSSLGSWDLLKDNLPTQLLFWTPAGYLTKSQMKGAKKPLQLEAVFKKTPGSVIYSLQWQPLAAKLPIRDVCLFSKFCPNGNSSSFNTLYMFLPVLILLWWQQSFQMVAAVTN